MKWVGHSNNIKLKSTKMKTTISIDDITLKMISMNENDKKLNKY